MNQRIIRSVAAFLLVATAIAAGSFAVRNGGKNEETFSVSGELAAETLALRQGSRGATVRQIQQKLKNWGYYGGSVDGIFGAQTRKAVVYFQGKNGLTADGIVGAKTLAALGIVVTNTAQKENSAYSSSDTNLLARLIYAEARGGILCGAGGGRRRRTEPGEEFVFSQYDLRRDLSALRLYLRAGRADQPKPGSGGSFRRERRDERLGSVLREPVLL